MKQSNEKKNAINDIYVPKCFVMDIFILDSYVVILFSDKWTSWGLFVGTQITPQDWIFWTIIFYHQKIQVKSYLMRGQT